MKIFGRKGLNLLSPSNFTEKTNPIDLEVEENSQRAAVLDLFRGQAHTVLMSKIDLQSLSKLSSKELHKQVQEFIFDYANAHNSRLNEKEQLFVAMQIVHDMVGLGPLEPLLADDGITDIMVNGPSKIYIEKKGRIQLTKAKFRDARHLVQVAQRIAIQIGRRVDESSPIVDARLLDGSRVNIVLPPVALDGASISIRKFSKTAVSFKQMIEGKTIIPEMARLLEIASACRLNTLVSGGTGSGKTTLLNALSTMISESERIVTIEDSAELRLQQPHVVRLESRPANIEGEGKITIRDLVKNALRMRPERIIIGEVRGDECLDMLQAMNTGHDGSMATVHANSASEALDRLENLVSMAGGNLPSKVIRQQIASALDIIIQTERMRDGKRRIKEITEVIGLDKRGEFIIQNLFHFEFLKETEEGEIIGRFVPTTEKPHFFEKARYYSLDEELVATLKTASSEEKEG